VVYLVERLLALTDTRWFTAVLAVIVFGVAHVPAWGTRFAMTVDLPAGALLVAGYFLATRPHREHVRTHRGPCLATLSPLRNGRDERRRISYFRFAENRK
jgi:hypothetical protein